MPRTPLLPLGLTAALLAACAAPPTHLAPEGVESAFEFLALRYDRNGDGAVDPTEYRRSPEGFVKLDADGDGRLTALDFPEERYARELGIRDIPEPQRSRLRDRYAARAVVLAYLAPRATSGAPTLTAAELEHSFAGLDRDGSGTLDEREFSVATEELPWGGPGQAWEVLLAGIDAPPPAPPAPEPPSPDDSAAAQADEPAPPPAPDGRLSLDELLAYQRSMADAQGVLRGPAGLDPRAAAPGLAGDGPPVGTLAPDFELSALEGGSRVRLSEWRGHRAVALIFGSYT